jgi:hypothetical protein
MSAAKHKKTYHFHNEWEEHFFVIMHKDKCICLLCKPYIICILEKIIFVECENWSITRGEEYD